MIDIRYTTQTEEIDKFFRTEKNLNKFILVTYDSFPVLFEYFEKKMKSEKETTIKIDDIVFDEAHHCTSDDIAKILFKEKKCRL